MDFKIAGISLYYIINWFFIYSFLGWIWESCYVSVKNKKPVNRGFVNGPFCTIYGFGAVSVYLILKDFDQSILVLYLGGVVVATLLEYVTGWLMEVIFHTRWWDYSKQKYNLHGYICLGSSIAWGFFTVILFKVLQPFVQWITGLYSVTAGKIGICVITVLYGADFIVSASAAFDMKKRFTKAEEMLSDIASYVHAKKLYETGEEIRDKFDDLFSSSLAESAEKLSLKKAEFMERLEEKTALSENRMELRVELEKRLDEFSEWYLNARRKTGFVKKRMFYAYPGLRLEFKHHRDRKIKKRK